MNRSQSLPAWLGSRILLSFLAALAGWVAGGVFFIALSAIETSRAVPGFELLMYGIVVGVVLLIVGLILILPISLFVPSGSLFWKPIRLTLIGMVFSQVIGMPYYLWQQMGDSTFSPMSARLLEALSYGVLLAVIGGATGFVAAILNRRF